MSGKIIIQLDVPKKLKLDSASLQKLSSLVLNTSMNELSSRYGDSWYRDFQPMATLSPPSLTVIFDLNDISLGKKIDSVFREHFNGQVKKLFPSVSIAIPAESQGNDTIKTTILNSWFLFALCNLTITLSVLLENIIGPLLYAKPADLKTLSFGIIVLLLGIASVTGFIRGSKKFTFYATIVFLLVANTVFFLMYLENSVLLEKEVMYAGTLLFFFLFKYKGHFFKTDDLSENLPDGMFFLGVLYIVLFVAGMTRDISNWLTKPEFTTLNWTIIFFGTIVYSFVGIGFLKKNKSLAIGSLLVINSFHFYNVWNMLDWLKKNDEFPVFHSLCVAFANLNFAILLILLFSYFAVIKTSHSSTKKQATAKLPDSKSPTSCTKCGQEVSAQPSMAGGRMASDYADQLKNTMYGYFCPSCNKGFCKDCCISAARQAGKGGFTCPECLELIGDYPWK